MIFWAHIQSLTRAIHAREANLLSSVYKFNFTKNVLTETPRIMFGQISKQLNWHRKLTIVDTHLVFPPSTNLKISFTKIPFPFCFLVLKVLPPPRLHDSEKVKCCTLCLAHFHAWSSSTGLKQASSLPGMSSLMPLPTPHSSYKCSLWLYLKHSHPVHLCRLPWKPKDKARNSQQTSVRIVGLSLTRSTKKGQST